MPLLESLSAGIVGHLNGLADELGARRDEAGDPPEGAFIPPLPRAIRLALAALASSRSTTGRVKLPHGLVVRFEPSALKSG